jgi:hypothetical protein
VSNDKPRPSVPGTRLIETPNGMLTIELGWMKQTGMDAKLALFGPDGWKADKRFWVEKYGALPDRDNASLSQVISDWTGMPSAEAEALVTETVARWRGSSAFDDEIRVNRSAGRAKNVLFAVRVLALVGVGAVIWLVVSALT